MARTTAISARITGDNSDFKRVLADSDAAAQAWSRRMAATSTAQVGKGGGGGMAMMQLAQAVDDVQYGMRGVLNNIPGLLTSLGAGAGLAGVVTMAAIGVFQLGGALKDWWLNAKAAKEATDFVAGMDGKLKEALAKSAREAANGTEEGAAALKAATEAAEENFKNRNASLQNRARLAREAADAEMALAMARIQASGASDESKAAQAMQLQEQAAQEAHSAEQERIGAEIDLINKRSQAFTVTANEAARRAQQARSDFEAINRTSSEGTRADPVAIELAYNKMEATAKDYEKAREQAQKASAEAVRQSGMLGQQVQQNAQLLETRLKTIRLEGQAEIDAAAEAAAQKDAARWKKKMEDARRAAEEERKWRAEIEQKIQAERAETARKNEEQKKSLAILQAEAEIARMRAGGRNQGADRRQRELDLQRESERIQADTGVGPEEARRLAEDLNPDPRRAGRINARARRRTEDLEAAAPRRPLGAGAFGGLRDRLDREIGQVGLPPRARGQQEASSREQLTRAPEVAQDSGRTLKEMAKSLEAIQVNTEGLSKKKSEALARA